MILQRQVAEGIDAVIVDSVLAIRKGLTEHQNKDTPSDTPEPSPRAQPASGALKDSIQIPVLNQAEQKDSELHIKPEDVL